MIPYGRQEITQDDIDAIVTVLKSDFLTQGPMVPQFENALAKKVGATYAVAVNSATSALHLACLALDLDDGDILWTTPITFVASANCGLYCGADIDFVDIDPLTLNISVSALEYKLIEAEKQNRLPKIIVSVHFCGQSCDMSSIASLSKKYGFSVIEDASHAIGGQYKNGYIGSSIYSDITVFSFHPVKIITTAEGGMALTNDRQLAEKMSLLRSHGITRDQEKMTHEPEGDWYYQQVDLGFNYRMTDLQAALGYSQLKRLDEYVARRNLLADRYDSLLMDFPVTLPYRSKDNYSAFHLYVIRIELNKTNKPHRKIFSEFREKGIGVNLHYIPVHIHPYYQSMGFNLGDYPESEAYYSEAISLPIFPSMTEEQQDVVVTTLREVL